MLFAQVKMAFVSGKLIVSGHGGNEMVFKELTGKPI